MSWGEDAFVDVGVPQLAKTRPGNFMNAIPFSTFVVTVAHLGPSPEHAISRGRPARCDAVQFRVDELTVKAEDGFRVSSQRASDRCSIVANALFYADPSTTAPIPLALIPSVSPSSKHSR